MQWLFKLALAGFSLAFVFILFNATFPVVFHQTSFPRGLVEHVGQFQYPLYPDTYDRGALDSWGAVVGDSYGQGMGDAYLDGETDYSIFHHVRKKTGRSYLIFARSGFGSINAARQLIVSVELMNRAMLFPDLPLPDEVFVLLYEGNDLDNNIQHLAGVADDPEAVRAFVRSEMAREASLKDRVESRFPFAGLPLRILRGLMRTAASLQETPNRLELQGEKLDVLPLQGAAMELSEAQIDRALLVFDTTLEVLHEWSPQSRIRVVYLPSVVSSYDWKEPVLLNAYHGERARRVTSEENFRQSQSIRAKVRALVGERGHVFIDTTDGVRERGKSEFLHGPRDWEHPNELGYQVMAEVIAEDLD